ncbi:hypothetical protein V1514DRAFT_290704 [Lipomyces japonicus]|uniref:uncharacterized protein n=1 Tax=Lipomyces japonicus TaxID=56871 RepID=UPI0034CF064B
MSYPNYPPGMLPPGVSGAGQNPSFPPGSAPPILNAFPSAPAVPGLPIAPGIPGFALPPGVPGIPGGLPVPFPVPQPGFQFPPPAGFLNGKVVPPVSNIPPPVIKETLNQDEKSPEPEPEPETEEQEVVSGNQSFLVEHSLRQATNDEGLNTMFIGELPSELDDFWLAKFLRAAGPLTAWVRVKDAFRKPKDFAFAEYADTFALTEAATILQDLELSVIEVEEGEEVEDLSLADRKSVKLLIKINESSTAAAQDQQPQEDDTEQRRNMVNELLEIWKDPIKREEEKANSGDDEMNNNDAAGNGFELRIGGDDELTDIPPEQRAIVLEEIAAFRERTNQRERERIKKEEAAERVRQERIVAERQKNAAREASPITVGESQWKSNEKIAFKRSSSVNESDISKLGPDAEGLSDEALEERRREVEEDALEERFIDSERKYLREERSRIAAADRELRREKEEKDHYLRNKEYMLKRLAEWNDDIEADKRSEEYYRDRSSWVRGRAAFRSRELENDERDAERERREAPKESINASALADSFLEQLGEFKREPSRANTPLSAGKPRQASEESKRERFQAKVEFKKEESPKPEPKPISIGISKPTLAPTTGSKFKLALGGKKAAVDNTAKRPETKAPFGDEDDDEKVTKKRKLIPLSYDKA